MPSKPKRTNPEPHPSEVLAIAREQSSELAKVRDMAKRPMKKGKLTKGNRRRA